MTILQSEIAVGSEQYQQNREALLNQIAEVRAVQQKSIDKSYAAKPKFDKKGKILPHERVRLLLDADSPFVELCGLVGYNMHDDKEGSEAGGHIGPVSTSVLAQEILPNIKEVPVFVAGGIGRGEMVANYLKMGAAGVQMGTIFVCSDECIAHDNFKQAFIRASARDVQSTVQIDNDFPVIPVRAISNQGSKDFLDFQKQVIEEYKSGKLEKHDAQMKIEHYWAGALRKAVVEGDVQKGSLMAGQSVGLVKEIKTMKNIIEEIIEQAENFLN